MNEDTNTNKNIKTCITEVLKLTLDNVVVPRRRSPAYCNLCGGGLSAGGNGRFLRGFGRLCLCSPPRHFTREILPLKVQCGSTWRGVGVDSCVCGSKCVCEKERVMKKILRQNLILSHKVDKERGEKESVLGRERQRR